MRIGAIDCGTNSIRLLIADAHQTVNGVKLTDCERLMRIVRLGEGVDATGRFSQVALDRTFAAAREYAEILQKYGVEKIRFGATSATRDAQNRDVFISGIKEILGVEPEVISGEEEASLSFAGAVSALESASENTVVVDLGGGSTEFVMGNSETGVLSAISTNIGCVRLTERYSVSAPVTEKERAEILADVDEAIETASKVVDFSAAHQLVGVAGTVTTITAQFLGLDSYQPSAINATELTVEETKKTAEDLIAMDRNQRMELGFMHGGRVDVIGAGALIWERIVERLNELSGGKISSAITSEFDILDGIALSQVTPS